MSNDKISIATLEEFIKKVRLAAKSGQKEIRIPTAEAENLVHHLSLLNLRVIDNYQEKTVEEVVTTVTMDGGGF
jgi:hypothetical protein